MTLKYPVGGNSAEFKRVPSGTHIAVCNLIADVGLQPGSQMYPKPKRKVYFRFEVPAERIAYERDGREVEGPLTIGSFYTASMNEKAVLRAQLEGWRGRAFTDAEAAEFDVASPLGKACMISVVEDSAGGKTYSNIKSISGLPKGTVAPTAENPLLFYSDERREQYALLPEWLRKKIDSQLQPEPEKSKGASGGAELVEDDLDSIPF